VDVAPIVAALGGEHLAVASNAELAAAVAGSVGRPGVRVIELRTERRRNVELHRAVAAVVARALATGVPA
jgi:2-succinyl-5-enolpyruvyl-6-hydroxy-3-cyclohexene-1-carboxylate synthase